MALNAGFSEIDITPSLGTEKAGWLRKIIADTIVDPLYAHVLVLDADGTRLGFLSLDVLGITASQVARIREGAERVGIPAANLMVAATHNHAGPAVANIGPSVRDEAYVDLMIERTEHALQAAVANLASARLGISSCTEGRVAFIRRFIMKDGTVRTHPPAHSPDIRCAEGVTDPELAVICVKDSRDRVVGLVVNFACHPTHHGGDARISAGWPGQLSMALKREYGDDCVTVFLNGAFGNISHANPLDPDYDDDMQWMGNLLASRVVETVGQMEFDDDAALGCAYETINIPYRDLSGPYGAGYALAQPFGAPGVYEKDRQKLRERIAKQRHEPAEIQCIRIGDGTAFVGVPGELFAQIGLRIKMESGVARTLVVAAANGMLGYVPHKQAFERGGYETTMAGWSKMAPEAGDMVAEAALDLLGRQ